MLLNLSTAYDDESDENAKSVGDLEMVDFTQSEMTQFNDWKQRNNIDDDF